MGIGKPRLLGPGFWAVENEQGQTIAIGDAAVITAALAGVREPTLEFLPLQPIRGQTTQLESEGALANMKCTVCHDGYTPPARHGQHCIGATYGFNETTTEEREEDHQQNLAQLASNVPSLSASLPARLDSGTESQRSVSGIAAVRCATSDTTDRRIRTGQRCLQSRLRWITTRSKAANSCTATQYRGALGLNRLGSWADFSALLSETLVSMMLQRPPPLPRYLLQAVSPARFLRRDLIKGGS